MNFESLFISEDKPYKGKSKRDKFLSRVFGIFNEEIFRIWCNNERSPFVDLGRPTIYDKDGRHYTLDFLLEDEKGRKFITEMKCEIEYQKYKFLTLYHRDQLKHHRNKRAFQLLLEVAQEPEGYEVSCNKEAVQIAGSSLVWGRTTQQGIKDVKGAFQLSHVLSTESVVADLVKWGDQNYLELIGLYEYWSSSLFHGLTGRS
ncbi:hypothetical protein [Pseudoalteromonas sp. T1lg122]|uniref:hypothetical protein n=1 Tax=Pseudoalteromonas sp. T1lg122 TaxID=2077094 RepID=UPI000CF726B5|nr:hypothetical protein [Pseudoalteromonas sp. T1lg122]